MGQPAREMRWQGDAVRGEEFFIDPVDHASGQSQLNAFAGKELSFDLKAVNGRLGGIVDDRLCCGTKLIDFAFVLVLIFGAEQGCIEYQAAIKQGRPEAEFVAIDLLRFVGAYGTRRCGTAIETT